MTRAILAALSILVSTSLPAAAHIDPLTHGSMASGLLHPVSGVDHVLAMIAIGLWAALIGGRATWLVPVSFVAMMGVGFLAAVSGSALPHVEPVILASIVTLGLLVAIAWHAPVAVGMGIAAVFALFHGHAHGSEVGTAAVLPYASGFMIATAALHLGGIALGMAAEKLLGRGSGRLAVRVAGASVAAAGLGLALSV